MSWPGRSSRRVLPWLRPRARTLLVVRYAGGCKALTEPFAACPRRAWGLPYTNLLVGGIPEVENAGQFPALEVTQVAHAEGRGLDGLFAS